MRKKHKREYITMFPTLMMKGFDLQLKQPGRIFKYYCCNILVLSCLLDAICELNLCSNIRRLMFKKEFDTSYVGFNSGSELLSCQNLCNAYLDFKIHVILLPSIWLLCATIWN